MRSLPFWSTCLVVAGAALAYPAAAYACTPDSKEYKEATARTEQAAKRYSDKDYNGSRVAMAQAYALCPTYKTLRNLIMTEVASGRSDVNIYQAAARHIHLYLGLTDPRVTEIMKSEVKDKYLSEVRQHLGMVQILLPKGVAGANVTIDNEAFPPGYGAEEAVEFVPGTHVVVLNAGGRRQERAIQVGSGKTVTVDFSSESNATAMPPVREPVKEPIKEPIKEPVPPPPEPDRSGLACPKSGACLGTTIGLGVLGVAGAVGAVVFNSSAASAKDDADALHSQNGACNGTNPSGCAAQAKDLEDSHSSRLMLSRISLGVGAASLVTAGVLFFVWPSKSKKETATWITPIVSPNTAGMGLTGRF